MQISSSISNARRYLYGQDLPDLSAENAGSLLLMADKYDIGDLARRCTAILIEKLDPENCMRALEMAHLCNNDSLKNAVSNSANYSRHWF